MKIWNFGIAGSGLIADFHARAITSLPNARLVGICGTNKMKTQALALKYSCRVFPDSDSMISSPDIEIITIATPSGAHMEPAISAAVNGKHALCEKPLEISAERMDRMIAAHEKAGTRLGGIFNYRYHDTLKHIKSAVDNGRFGTITCASVFVPWWRPATYYNSSWHGTLSMDGGGALINQAVHMIDILQYLMGTPESVQAYTAALGHEIEAEDTATVIVRFKNGSLGIIYGTTASWPGQYRRLEITGTSGTVIQEDNSFRIWQFEQMTEADNDIISRYSTIKGGGGVSDPGSIPFEPHAANIEAFIRAVESGSDFELDAVEARKAVDLVLAAYRSAAELKICYL